MLTLILILTCVIFALFAAGAFYIAHKEKQEWKEIEKKYNEAVINAEKTNEIISKANETKNAARSSDHSNDIDFIGNKLHEYANR